MELEIRILTPLWTGGVDAGKVNRIHETGITGSLRWWPEVFVRGLGGQVNDPTQDERSGFDQKKYDRFDAKDERARLRDAGLCDVSQVFGATGWRRRFRLDIQDRTGPDHSVTATIQAQRSYTVEKGNTHTPTWYFPNNLKDKPRAGNVTIQIQSLAQNFHPEVMAGLVQFVADWTAIGARTQMGFGLVELVKGRLDARQLYGWLIATTGGKRYPELPSLENIVLARIHKPNATEQDTFNLKYDLRQLFKSDKNLRHFIMGTVQDERMAAKVKISRPYGGGLIRVWGWIPGEAGVYTGSWNRNTVVDAIYQHLKTNYSLQVWREMNSTRDAVTPNAGYVKVFLHSLLGLKENSDAA
jgi:CRISPR-associated protein Cmr1